MAVPVSTVSPLMTKDLVLEKALIPMGSMIALVEALGVVVLEVEEVEVEAAVGDLVKMIMHLTIIQVVVLELVVVSEEVLVIGQTRMVLVTQMVVVVSEVVEVVAEVVGLDVKMVIPRFW